MRDRMACPPRDYSLQKVDGESKGKRGRKDDAADAADGVDGGGVAGLFIGDWVRGFAWEPSVVEERSPAVNKVSAQARFDPRLCAEQTVEAHAAPSIPPSSACYSVPSRSAAIYVASAADCASHTPRLHIHRPRTAVNLPALTRGPCGSRMQWSAHEGIQSHPSAFRAVEKRLMAGHGSQRSRRQAASSPASSSDQTSHADRARSAHSTPGLLRTHQIGKR